jgi:Helix-turn-helix domain
MSSDEKVPGGRTAASGGRDDRDARGDQPHPGAPAAGQRPDAPAGERRPLPPPSERRARQYRVDDPAVMRALAHPLRWALLEALQHAGTLTATQAGEILGETPANCAFHLRTLARYGLVEEAGGGKGRERPWRRAITGLTMELTQEDPKAAAAAGVLNEFWTNRTLDRARAALQARPALDAEWRRALVSTQSLRYVTRAEAEELQAELMAVLDRFGERNDDPALRPADAMPIEYLALSYPLQELMSRPAPGPEADPGSE